MTDKDSAESEILLEELRRQSKERREQHQESIQTLVALSIFAGYITAFFNNLFNNFALNVATTILAIVVFVFLLYKLILNSPVANGDLITSDRVDRIFSSLYLISVIGFGFVAVFIVGAEQFNISIQNISSKTVTFATTLSILPFMMLLFAWINKQQKEALHALEGRLRKKFPKALNTFEEAEVLDPQKRNLLIERLEALLDKDRQAEPDWLSLHSFTVMESEEFTSLSIDDRKVLLNIMERIERRDKYGEHDIEDLRKIEAIIEGAEES